jgi:hypothetical protein
MVYLSEFQNYVSAFQKLSLKLLIPVQCRKVCSEESTKIKYDITIIPKA